MTDDQFVGNIPNFDSESIPIHPRNITKINYRISPRQRISTLICPNIQIKDRIWRAYDTHIRSFISSLGQSLLATLLWNGYLAPTIAVSSLLSASYKQRTLFEFEETDRDDENSDQTVAGESNDEDDSNETAASKNNGEDSDCLDDIKTADDIHDRIEYENWDITIGSEDAPSDATFGLNFDRYSSDNQNETGCIGRIKTMLDMAEEMDVPLYKKPIVDVAESGKNIEREGIKQAIRLLQHPQIEYFFVHNISRIARWHSFCLFLIDLMARHFDVQVVTAEGPVDMTRLEDLAMTWVTSMTGEIENRNKAENTLNGLIENFEEGNYLSWFKEIPIGYSEATDKLLKVNEDEVEVVKAIFNTFVEADPSRPYAETQDKINSHYAEILDDDELDGDQLKRMLQNPIYIGKPSVWGESIGDQGQGISWDDPELGLIDQNLFKRVNEKIKQTEEKQSDTTDSGELMDLTQLAFEFGLLPVVESSPVVAVHCPKCDAKMVRDGKKEITGSDERKVPIYKCQECPDDSNEQKDDEDSPDGAYKTYPNTLEHYKIRLFDKIIEDIDKLAKIYDLESI